MAKKETIAQSSDIDIMTADPTTLTSEQLDTRYYAEGDIIKRLQADRKVLVELNRALKAKKAAETAQAKIADLQATLNAKIEALNNPTPVVTVSESPAPVADETPAVVGLEG